MKRFFKQHCKCILWSVFSLATLYILRNVIVDIVLDAYELSWVSSIDQNALGMLFSVLCLFGSGYSLWNDRTNKKIISESNVCLVAIIGIAYLYLRIDGTISFNKLIWQLAYSDFLFIPIGTTLYLASKKKSQMLTDASQCSVFNDRPIDNEEEDELGFGKMINVLLDDVQHTVMSKSAFSIGLVGKWGQGKSSFANLLKGRLDPQKTILIEFNPRNSKNTESIAEDFFNKFSDALHPYHTGVKSSIKKYANALQIVLDDNIIGKFIRFFQNFSTSDSKEYINQAIREIGRTIYIVVDDLDRLTAKEILETLKLIDRNADFVNTVFITAYDKQYVNDVLQHYLGYKADTFTDKYFDYEVSLPMPDANSIFNVISKCISKSGEEDYQKTFSNFWNNNGRNYTKYFSNLRHVKRFTNILLNRYREVYADVDVKDFFLLTLLRYYDINTYNDIAIQRILRSGSMFMGGSTNILYLQKEALAKIDNRNWDFTKDVLCSLFPTEGEETNESYQRIRDVSYFDLYFYDYKEGKLYLKELNTLFSTPDDQETTKIVDEFVDKDSSGLFRYLENAPKSKVNSLEGLRRYLRLCLQYRTHCDLMNYSLLYELFDPLRDDSYKGYQKALGIQDKNTYASTILEIYKAFISEYPLQLQQLFQAEYQDNNGMLESILDKATFRTLELECQKLFLDKFDEQKNKMSDAFAISNIFALEGGKCDEEASRILLKFMNLHKEFIAANIHNVYPYQSNDGRFTNLTISIDHIYRKFTGWFPVDGFSFLDWINSLENNKLKFILTETYNQPDARLSVKALKPNYKKEDIDDIYEAIQKDYEDRDLTLIKRFQKNEDVYDLATLCKATKLKEERIFFLNENYNSELHLPYRLLRNMLPFEEGDIVRLTADAQKTLTSQTGIQRKLFKISSTHDDGSVHLNGVDSPIPIQKIRPVLIESDDDKGIIYDPYVAAATVVPDGEIPTFHHDDRYYLDAIKELEGDSPTIYEQITEMGLAYVHEIQHLLREGTSDDGLRLE